MNTAIVAVHASQQSANMAMQGNVHNSRMHNMMYKRLLHRKVHESVSIVYWIDGIHVSSQWILFQFAAVRDDVDLCILVLWRCRYGADEDEEEVYSAYSSNAAYMDTDLRNVGERSVSCCDALHYLHCATVGLFTISCTFFYCS